MGGHFMYLLLESQNFVNEIRSRKRLSKLPQLPSQPLIWLGDPKTTKTHWPIQSLHIEFIPPQKAPKKVKLHAAQSARISVCVCAFLIEANSSACKRSADRDPVLHNSQFVDVQIKLTAEYSQALFFVKPFAQQLPFQEEEDTSSF